MKATLEETIEERKSLEEAYRKQQNEFVYVNLFLFYHHVSFETHVLVGKISSFLSLVLFLPLLKFNN
jgi:hypothetical protein